MGKTHPSEEGKENEQSKTSSDVSSDLTKIIGSFGRWQLGITIILSIPSFFNAFHFLAITFFAPGADHWCKPPDGLYGNWSVKEWKNYSLPPDEEKPTKLSSCKMYDRNYSMVPDSPFDWDDNLTTSGCLFGWDYDRSHFKNSLENEFDLVCSREALAKVGASAFNAGVLFGVVISGQLSDIFGRKITMMCTLLGGIVFGIITSFMPTLTLFFITRFFLAACLIGCGTTSFVLMMEYLDKKWRSIVGVYSAFSWVFGYLLLPGFAYLVPDWRNLQLLISIPMILYIAFWWFVPESIRWLLSKNKVVEAEEIAKEAVRVNKRNVQVDLTEIHAKQNMETTARATLIDIFKYPKLRKYTLNMYFQWFVNSFVYYGLALNAGSLGGNLFVTFTISGLVEIPSNIVCAWVIMRFGRRLSYSVQMIVGGIACIATCAFEKDAYPGDWPTVTLAMIGKFCISATFMIVYIYSTELFPTPVRNVGLGSSSMFARIGSILAPFVDLLKHVHPAIPLVIFGLASVAAGFLVLLLPETNNKPLPQTFQDSEKL